LRNLSAGPDIQFTEYPDQIAEAQRMAREWMEKHQQ
jgi:hypothetical protein